MTDSAPRNNGLNWTSDKWFLACLCVIAAISSTPVDSSAVKTVPLKKNLKTFNDWTCKKPQPRVVHLDSLDDFVAPNVIYLPSALVVHRCDRSSGCCRIPGQMCTSVETAEEDVQFAIRANFIDSSGRSADRPAKRRPKRNHRDKRKKKEKKLVVTLSNHTRCHCVGRVDLRV